MGRNPALRDLARGFVDRSPANSGLVEASVDRRAGNPEQVGDLLDGVIAGVVELLGVSDNVASSSRPVPAEKVPRSG